MVHAQHWRRSGMLLAGFGMVSLRVLSSLVKKRSCKGYEIEGLENIPTEGPALIVFYHGPLPTDMYFVMAKMILYRRRMLASVGDRFLQLIPGMRLLCEVFKVTPGTVDSCVETLRKCVVFKGGGLIEILQR